MVAAILNESLRWADTHDRCTTKTTAMSKMSKVYSKASSCAAKLFSGTGLGAMAGSVAKPLKQFADVVDVVNVIDPINNLLAKDDLGVPNYKNWIAEGKWVRLAARVALIAGLALSPIILLSSLGWFPLGVLGVNIALYGTLPAIEAAKCAFILIGATLGFFDRNESIKGELLAEDSAKLKADIFEALSTYSDQPTQENEVKVKHVLYSTAGATDSKVSEAWNRFTKALSSTPGDEDRISYVEALKKQAEHAKKDYEQKHFKVVRTKTALQDDVCKIALLSLTFIGAFIVSGLMGTLFVAMLGLYGAYTAWTRADMDIVADEQKKEFDEWKIHNHHYLADPILKQLNIA